MRNLFWTNTFKKDFQRIKKGRYGKSLERDLHKILALLIDEVALPANANDHPLKGNWKDFRDCHIHPDLILIYRKLGEDKLELVRLGTHSDLSL